MIQFRIAGLMAALSLVTMLVAPSLAVADGGIFRATLRGFQEVPAVSTEASGEFSAKISKDENAIEYTLSYKNLTARVTQAHIHFGQLSVNGGIVVFLCQTGSNTDPSGGAPPCPEMEGTVEGKITPANIIGPAGQGIDVSEFEEFVKAVRSGVTYANVHTFLPTGGQPGSGFPSGEIRGQIRRGGGSD